MTKLKPKASPAGLKVLEVKAELSNNQFYFKHNLKYGNDIRSMCTIISQFLRGKN